MKAIRTPCGVGVPRGSSARQKDDREAPEGLQNCEPTWRPLFTDVQKKSWEDSLIPSDNNLIVNFSLLVSFHFSSALFNIEKSRRLYIVIFNPMVFLKRPVSSTSIVYPLLMV